MNRIQPRDGVRGIAILLVCLHHYDSKMKAGWVGVELFFVLSGFLITSILIQRENDPNRMRYFYIRRAKRILPLFIIAVLIQSVLEHGFLAHNWYWYALFLMNVRETLTNTTWIRSLWSLAIEEHFYLLWPMLFFALSRRNSARLLIAVLCISPFLRLAFTPVFSSYVPIYFLTPFRLDGLASGALLAILVHHQKMNIKPWVLTLGLALSLPIAYLSVHMIPGFYREANSMLFNSLGYSLVTLTATAFVLLAYMVGDSVIRKVLTFRPLMHMGTISYFVYIFHPLFLHVPFHNFLLNRLAAFGALVVVASGSWYLFEKPILRTTFWERPRVPAQVLAGADRS
jgi:peptidoglycan/LPS O-acetylase OafA/YrhL